MGGIIGLAAPEMLGLNHHFRAGSRPAFEALLSDKF
jgi:hypothetical protein